MSALFGGLFDSNLGTSRGGRIERSTDPLDFESPIPTTEDKSKKLPYRQYANNIDATPATPPVPKGCQEYFFNSNGSFHNGEGLSMAGNAAAVYRCVAMNDKSAIKKFKKNYNPQLL